MEMYVITTGCRRHVYKSASKALDPAAAVATATATAV